jgi:hypothetical protein
MPPAPTATSQLTPPKTLGSLLSTELTRRVGKRDLWDWQCRWLMYRRDMKRDKSAVTTNIIGDSTCFALGNACLIVKHEGICRPATKCVYPSTIWLRRDGHEVARWNHEWFFHEPRPSKRWLMIPGDLRGDCRPFATTNCASFSWTVEVCGDPCIALLKQDVRECWTGRFTVPLQLEETPEILQFVQR